MRAVYKNTFPVVFEIQLSTTFLDVVLGRRDFYRKKGELLIWIFKQFSVQDARMMEFDTFHANNMNAIVLDRDAFSKCKSKMRLSLKCVWVEPTIKDGDIFHVEKSDIFDFDELNKIVERQQIFKYDYDTNRKAIDLKIVALNEALEIEAIRNNFFESFDPTFEADDLCRYANKFFPDMGLCNNHIKWRLRGFFRMMNAAKTGNPKYEGSGWNYNNFKNIFDNVFKSHTSLFFLFCCAMKAYSRNETSVSINKRKREAWDSIREEGAKSKFHHAPVFAKLTEVLFPEVHKTYLKIMSKADQNGTTSSATSRENP